MNTKTDIESRNSRICATYNSYRAKPFKHSSKRGHKADALMQTARTWKMPIREVRLIIEAGQAQKLGVDPKQYSAEKALERSAKTTEWQKERDSFKARQSQLGIRSDADPRVMDRLLTFLNV